MNNIPEYPFKPTRTALSQQSYLGARHFAESESVRTVNPPDGRAYTVKRAKCPECRTTGYVKDYHGTNCFWDCEECGTPLKL